MWDQLEAVGSAESRRISVVLTCFAGGVVFCMPAEHLTGQHTHPEPPTASIVGAATGTIKHASAKSQ